MSVLKLKSVSELLGQTFFIPDYQRGYRWTKSEVQNLLYDFHDFTANDLKKDDFYCLQPLVVCKSEKNSESWEVIDGQQRLTTIYLILQYLSDYLKKKNIEPYIIEYETRPGSKSYLQNITDDKKDDNFDYHNIYIAKTIIEEFLTKKCKDDDLKFLQIFTNSMESGKNAQFIWYDVTDEVESGKIKPVDVFTRLNIGKIPLTNAELIKALFLNKKYLPKNEDAAKEVQVRIAQDWDLMQQKLEQDDFWYFIYGSQKFEYQTRIEFLFDLLMENEHKNDEEDRWTFNEFYADFEDNDTDRLHATSELEWKKVRDLFITLENWHENRILYHLVGYNTATGTTIAELLQLFNKQSSSNFDFKKKLLQKTQETCKLKNENVKFVLEGLNYPDNKIKNILLLFNVLSMLKNKKSEDKFPFQYYLTQNWDIEHISPQTEQDISGADRKSWIETNISYFTGADFYKKDKNDFIEQARKNLPTDEKEKAIAESLINLYEMLDDKKIKNDEKDNGTKEIRDELKNYFKAENDEIENKDSISNLALLDSSTNRMYKNAFFPVKRYWIIQQEKDGAFIPLCTKNVFMKAYSKDFSQLASWTQNDAESYLEEIENVITQSNEEIEND